MLEWTFYSWYIKINANQRQNRSKACSGKIKAYRESWHGGNGTDKDI